MLTDSERDGAQNDLLTHVDLGIDICKAILEEESSELCSDGAGLTASEDIRKTLASLLSKLYLPEVEAADDRKLKSLMLVVTGIRDVCFVSVWIFDKLTAQRRPLQDAVSRNALTRFEASLKKKYAEQLEGSDEADFRAIDEVKELCDMIEAV